MNTISATSLTISFTYALLFSLLQGALLYGILRVLLRAFPASGARVRYNLSFSTLIAQLIWFADTWVSQYNRLAGVTVYVMPATTGNHADTANPMAVSTAPDIQFDLLKEYLPQLSAYIPYIITAYCAGLIIMLLRFGVNVWRTRSMTLNALPHPSAHWDNFIDRWSAHLGINKQVKLLLSADINVPVMLGWLKPVILIPVATISNLSTEQTEAIIMHELAHIRRHDYLLNIIQTTIETILFFNPFVWLTSRIVRTEREHCCDDIVVECAADPMHYARALTLLEEDRINSLALAATGNKNQLLNRIKRIMEMKKRDATQRRSPLIAVTVTAVLLAGSLVIFKPSLAQKADKGKNDTAKKTTTTKTVTKSDDGKKKTITKTTTVINDDNKSGNAVKSVKVKVYSDGDDDATANIIVTDGDNGTRKEVRKTMVYTRPSAHGHGQTIIIDKGELRKELKSVKKEMIMAKNELESIDWEEIGREISDALEEVGRELHIEDLGNEIKIEVRKEGKEMHRAMAEARRDAAEARAEAHSEIAEARRKEALTRAKMARERAEEHRAEAEARRKEAHSEIAIARREAAHARADRARERVEVRHIEADRVREMANAGTLKSEDIESMLSKMEHDGLISRSKKFRIEKDGNELFINGQKQSDAVLRKYKGYLKGEEIVIKGNKNSLSVNISD